MIAVVTHDYPRPGSNAAAFVQARVDLYRRRGHEVHVHTRLAGREIPERPDVIAAHYPLPEYVIPAVRPWLGRVPVVAYLHGAEAIATPDKGPLWGLRARVAVRRFVRRCDAVVTCSRWMQDQVLAYLGVRSDVIPNPVDSALFPLLEHEGDAGLCLRGKARKYGTDLLSPGMPVDVLEPTLARRDLPDLLRRYGFFVAPSRLEGQGLMACEAAATGMPIVSTRAGGIPEFIHDPYSVLVGPDDRRALGQAVAAVRSTLPLSGSARATIRDAVLASCGPEATVDRDLELFASGATKGGAVELK